MSKPFVIDMRHDMMADSTYGVAETWDGALKIAGDFWEQYDGEFDPNAKQPFKVGDGYVEELEVKMRKNVSLYLSHAGGEGPYITIRRASTVR